MWSIKIPDDELHRAYKMAAVARGQKLTDLVSAVLRDYASRELKKNRNGRGRSVGRRRK